ncbi:MAG TPA: NAD(P)/FAD-dependent oxidoreductase [Pyrinomonadaceae bacterium]|nr:NAD(P)/FAD-dependent oxidoreductase [Pyrinomonadaceae bacterium]
MSMNSDYDVIIAGGGPAGSSAAIHLALRGARVLLAEQKKFPRPKLCGEFISPECFTQFERLGVSDQMLASSPSPLTETVFYSQAGARVSVPSTWFSKGGVALGLSRAEMDERLLRRAAEVGVDVREETSVTSLNFESGRVTGVNLKAHNSEELVRAPITIDATGRARVLARMAEKNGSGRSQQRELVAFKAHLQNTGVAPGACEIYFYRGGYGGLSSIENGLSNLCFIVNARDVRRCQSNADRVVRSVVCRNQRASLTLREAVAHSAWLAVSLEGFGRHSPAPVDGLLTIGDAASFIDPFTGSGMLMALESGELVANIIMPRLPQLHELQRRSLSDQYCAAYGRQFNSRLRLCSLIRRAAFAPGVADFAIRLFGASDSLRKRVARATRSQPKRNFSSAREFK